MLTQHTVCYTAANNRLRQIRGDTHWKLLSIVHEVTASHGGLGDGADHVQTHSMRVSRHWSLLLTAATGDARYTAAN